MLRAFAVIAQRPGRPRRHVLDCVGRVNPVTAIRSADMATAARRLDETRIDAFGGDGDGLIG